MKRTLSMLLLLALPPAGFPARAAQSAQDAAKNIQTSPAASADATAPATATPNAAAPTSAQPTTGQSAALTNADISRMLAAQIAPEAVVAKIKTSPCRFDTSPAALQKLKEAGVADSVIMAMVLAPSTATTTNVNPSAAPATATAQPVVLKIPQGTIIDVEAAFDVSSQEVKDGEAISFRVVYPVKVEGVTVIEPGARASGRIIKARRGGHFGKAGTLVWHLQDVTAVDGSRVPLQFETRQRGDSKAAKVAVQTIAVGALLGPFAPISLFHGFKRGKNAFIPAGKRFVGFVQAETAVSAPRRE
ncbi:MAG TPA: hypothetical protein VNA19_05215 [Pyrinomonadaceae bacterium]|nr:hypothetical protein [Pyrinomonadaceae bacterium]